MSRYSHGGGGGDYHRGNSGGYRQGGYNNDGHRNSGGGFPYGKINEDDVPESQHSIFVRGLPSSINYDEIKNFFEDNIGPCSFDFQKVNYERQSLFIAVRFESKDHAKEAYNKYRDEDILGCRCEVTWFRDIRRYISYQQQTGGVIRRGSFGRGGQANRFHNNHRQDYRKRRYSDDRRSRSRSYSDSDRSRSRSRRSSKSRSSRSHSRSEGERSTSRESDRRRSVSKDEKRKDKKKEKKVKKSSKKDRRSRRSESASSRSDGERSRSSSRSDRDISPSKKKSKNDRRGREASPASSTGSPLRMTPPPPAPTIIGPIIPSATSAPTPVAPIEKTSGAPLSDVERSDDEDFTSHRSKNGKRQKKKRTKRDHEIESKWEKDLDIIEDKTEKDQHSKIMITIANKSTVPVENTSFKMALDSDEPPRKIVRGPLTPEKVDDDVMDVDDKEEEEKVPMRKENIPADNKGGWRTVGSDNSGPPSDVTLEAHPPAPSLIQTPTLAKTNGSPDKAANGIEMVPRSIGAPPSLNNTPNPPPPKRPPMGTPSSLPPPGRPSLGGGGGVSAVMATRCPEMSKTVRDIRIIQDQLMSTVKPPSGLRLSAELSGEPSMIEKMEEREKLINDLNPAQKNKFDIKMKQIAASYRGDAGTITSVVKSVLLKDAELEDRIKPALMAVLEDLEKQIYKKVDDFLVCGI